MKLGVVFEAIKIAIYGIREEDLKDRINLIMSGKIKRQKWVK